MPLFSNAATARCAGSAAIMAVAVIVLGGFIGMTLVSTLCVTSSSIATRAQGMQAAYIADAGVEWAAKHGTATTAPISFGGGSFEVVPDGDNFNVVGSLGEARCTLRSGESPNYTSSSTPTDDTGGIQYVLRSRVSGFFINSVDCIIMNTSEADIAFDTLKITWGSPTAYFQTISFKVANGTNYGTVWYYTDTSSDYRWASGDKLPLTRYASVTLPAHRSAELHFISFVQRRSSYSGNDVIMSSAVVNVEFYRNDLLVGTITVPVAGS